MKFLDVAVSGAKLVELEPYLDERGSFSRLHCEREFGQAGIGASMVQTNLSVTLGFGVLRGLHFQIAPSKESKLVRCMCGSVFDVIVDLRPQSPTYLQHCSVELTEQSKSALFVPAGCAHGFQTLSDRVEVLYQMTDFYSASLSRGVRWDDPLFAIQWPFEPTSMNERDRCYSDFDPALVQGFGTY